MGRELNPHMPSRETGLYFLIDTNRINARRALPYMNQLDQWRKDGVLGLLMPDVAHGEAKEGHNAERSRKASSTVFTISYTHNHVAREMRPRISEILFPDGCHSQNEGNDVEIVLAAWQHRPYPLITADRGILRKSEELAQLEISVMTDAEAVALVRKCIRERDDEARDFAANSEEPLPCWVGKD
jgi:hypothetical protein